MRKRTQSCDSNKGAAQEDGTDLVRLRRQLGPPHLKRGRGGWCQQLWQRLEGVVLTLGSFAFSLAQLRVCYRKPKAESAAEQSQRGPTFSAVKYAFSSSHLTAPRLY